MNKQDIINEALAWAEGTHCAITVCDLEGKVIFMNERSRATFDKEGRTMLGPATARNRRRKSAT